MTLWIPCQYESRHLELGQDQASTRRPSPPPPSRSLLHPDVNQQALLDNKKRVYTLRGFYPAVSCGLEIGPPAPSEDHIDHDPARKAPSYLSSSAGPCFCGSGVRTPPSTIQTFSRLSPCKIFSLVSPGNETACMLTGPPVYPTDLLSRRFRGGECSKA